MHRGKKPQDKLIRPNRSRPAQSEPLERRRLLSAATCEVVQPNLTENIATGANLVHPAATLTSVQGYTPAQIRHAYGFDQVSGTGNGQTIAIVDAYNDPDIASDLHQFDQQFGLPDPPSFNIVSQTGAAPTGIPTDGGWAAETSLDVEWAHAIAPGANILLVEAADNSLTNLLTAVDYARDAAGVSVVSMSWGGNEFHGEAADDTYFTTPADHTGVTFVASSGDSGPRHFGAEWPASSPDVLSVGGTSLNTSGSAGAYSTETPWLLSSGGLSRAEPEPAYQESAQDTGARTAPDVSYDANPNTGFAVYDSVPFLGNTGWQEYGGTSAGAPQWGALIAIANQARVTAGMGTLDGATQTLPALYAPYSNPTTYAADYHDVTAVTHLGWFGKRVIDIGYDLQTGLGSPNAGPLVQTLSQVSDGAPAAEPGLVRTVTASWTTTSALATQSIVVVTSGASPTPSVTVTSADSVPSKFTSAPVPSVAQVQGQAPVVFNDTLIHRSESAAALSVPGEGHIELTGLGASPRGIASASAAVAQWIGATDGSLISWLAGEETASLNESGFTPPFGDDAGSVAAVAGPANSFASAASRLVTRIAAPLVTGPAAVLYRFANFDPVGIFADSMADFARESASISQLDVRHTSHRAWIVTGIVLGVDAALAARWYAERIKVKKQTIASNPQSPQAGPLPTGL